MWSLNWHFVGYVQFAYCWQPLHIIDLLLNLRITLMIFGINKWILKFVSLDLVDIKFLNNNRWRIWFWRNQHFTDRGGVGGGYWAITEILEYITRVVCFMCSVTCTCSEALVGTQLQLPFLHIPRHNNILGYLYCVGLEEHLFFCCLYTKIFVKWL